MRQIGHETMNIRTWRVTALYCTMGSMLKLPIIQTNETQGDWHIFTLTPVIWIRCIQASPPISPTFWGEREAKHPQATPLSTSARGCLSLGGRDFGWHVCRAERRLGEWTCLHIQRRRGYMEYNIPKPTFSRCSVPDRLKILSATRPPSWAPGAVVHACSRLTLSFKAEGGWNWLWGLRHFLGSASRHSALCTAPTSASHCRRAWKMETKHINSNWGEGGVPWTCDSSPAVACEV